MKQPKPTTIDFESFKIQQRPAYPPVPTSVSIKYWGKAPKFYAWGHPTGNTCTRAEAVQALKKAWATPDGILCHNGKFDLDVAETHLGLPVPPWQRTHETTFLLFLHDPHQREVGLKSAAERLLGMPPEERDAVADWLVKHQPVPNIKIGKGKGSKHPAGAYTSYAPGSLVGEYANGDVVRTEALFDKLWKSVVVDRAMGAAYDRERKLMPILLASERGGIRVAHERLRADVALQRHWLAKIDDWIWTRLGKPAGLNLDAAAQLADALIAAGKADPALMGVTAGGAISTDKAAIEAGVTDKVLGAVLKHRAQLKTCLITFMETWLRMADASGGFIFTNWNQIRGEKGGTRTGRLSSSPNFQNIPKEFVAIFRDAKHPHLPKCPWKDLPGLPLCRSYIIPYRDGDILIGRDYSQQEPRILAHFEDGELKAIYVANPWMDYHDSARDHLERVTKKKYLRKPVKNINLGIIYGQGVGSLAEKNGSTVEETKEIRDAIYKLYPGLREMYTDMRARAKAGEPIRTWGGREYYCEPAKIIKGRLMEFDYKMVNVLIQGSAAEATKEAMIRYIESGATWPLLLQVHDEIVISAPKAEFSQAMETLRLAMESLEFDVPMLSEGAWSVENWASMREYDVKGKLVDALP